jgi:hypothetical protein
MRFIHVFVCYCLHMCVVVVVIVVKFLRMFVCVQVSDAVSFSCMFVCVPSLTTINANSYRRRRYPRRLLFIDKRSLHLANHFY